MADVTETKGIQLNGFQDAAGEYPKEDYQGESSINKAAKGETVNEVFHGGPSPKGAFPYTSQKPSLYPFNQVQETPSGHIIEIDDTPAGERIMIRHRTGTGVELKPDGSLVLGTVTNRIDYTGGSANEVIEGNSRITVGGNLKLEVNGNFDIEVGGSMTTKVKGYLKQEIRKFVEETVGEYLHTYIQGGEEHFVGDSAHYSFENAFRIYTENMTSKVAKLNLEAYGIDVKATETNLASILFNISAEKGAIGGSQVDMFANSVTSINGFKGNLFGVSMASNMVQATPPAIPPVPVYYPTVPWGETEGLWDVDFSKMSKEAIPDFIASDAVLKAIEEKTMKLDATKKTLTHLIDSDAQSTANKFSYFLERMPTYSVKNEQKREKMDVTSKLVLDLNKFSTEDVAEYLKVPKINYQPTQSEAKELATQPDMSDLKSLLLSIAGE